MIRDFTEINTVYQERFNGISKSEIARRHYVSEGTIRRWLKLGRWQMELTLEQKAFLNIKPIRHGYYMDSHERVFDTLGEAIRSEMEWLKEENEKES
jgi:hypothetical protein